MAINMTFVDFVTPVPADWLNNVNTVVNNQTTFPVVTSINALRNVTKTNHSTVFVAGYYGIGDGGGGNYFLNLADTTSADNGGTIIVANDGGRWYLQWFGQVSVLQFGVKADAGVTDNSTTLANCAAWVATGAIQNKLFFPAGIYGYSISPNWAIQNATIEAYGEVRLRYSGIGNAVILDTGPTINTFTYNVNMGGTSGFIVEAPSTAGHGVYVRSVHHSKLRFKVEGAGVAKDGIRVEFAVCTNFDNCSVTANEAGAWFSTTPPLNGLHLTQRNTGEQTSYCKMDNLVCEGLSATGGAGILLESTIGNNFYGGTSEACYYGILTGTSSSWNKFFGMDMESNTQNDIFDQGAHNEFHSCDTATSVFISGVALWPHFVGGNHQLITIGSGARYASFTNVVVHRVTGTGGFTNNEPTSIFTNCFDAQSQTIVPLTQGTISTPASGGTYTNNTGNTQIISIVPNGATISAVTITRNAVNNNLATATTQVTLKPQDGLTLTYTVATPQLYFYSE